MSVCFQINVYEKTYKDVLENKLEYFLKELKYNFDEYLFIDNGVDDKENLKNLLKRFPKFSLLTVGENDEEVLNHFEQTNLGIAYKYSAPHFYSIYYSKSDFIFHISEDIFNLQIEVSNSTFFPNGKIKNGRQ